MKVLWFRESILRVWCVRVGHVNETVPTDSVEICVNRFSLAIFLALQVKTKAAIMANPRKFSEKIALHNQKQAEETAAFEQIMREVSDATSKVSFGDIDNFKTPFIVFIII
jgi:hypothetical protein